MMGSGDAGEEIKIPFVFPGEGMCIDGGIVTPDSEMHPEQLSQIAGWGGQK